MKGFGDAGNPTAITFNTCAESDSPETRQLIKNSTDPTPRRQPHGVTRRRCSNGPLFIMCERRKHAASVSKDIHSRLPTDEQTQVPKSETRNMPTNNPGPTGPCRLARPEFLV
jgi:hypothetical protein